ncbi:MAG: elongation factor G [bacterium]
MPNLASDQIRSFTLLGASGSGKTSLAEALLFASGVTHRLGKVDDLSSHLDTDPEEQKRRITLLSKIQTLPWQGYRLHLADTPGFADFLGEAVAPLAALDAAVIVVDATTGVDVATKQLFNLAVQHKKPILFFINKMDKERADFERTLESIRNNLSKHAHPVSLPIGEGSGFKGVLDLIDTRAFLYNDGKSQETKVPPEEEARFDEWQKKLIEEVAETDEALFEKLAGGEDLKKGDILPRLIQDIEEEEIIPVLVGSANPPKGITLLLDTLTHLILPPSQLPELKGKNPVTGNEEVRRGLTVESAAAQVFKVVADPGVGDIFFAKVFSGTLQHGQDFFNPRTKEKERLGHLFFFNGKDRQEVKEAFVGDVVGIAKLKNTRTGDTLCDFNRPILIEPLGFPQPVLSMALLPKTRQDQEKMGFALGKVGAYDPTFHYHTDSEFSETIVSGMGEVHLEVITERLKNKNGIEISLGKPHVPYRETITRKVEVQGKYKKQSGGHGQYGDVWLRVEPKPINSGFEFSDEIKGGVIPSKYVPSVELGVREAMMKGMLAGYPVVDLKAALYDGSFHSVDSSDLAFQIAGSMALKKAEEEAKPILLEPVMSIEVMTPADYVGAITNDLTTRRGKILGMDQEGDLHVIRGEVPMAEVFKYATDLRSLTHGAGRHKMEFVRYEPVPGNLMDRVVKENSRLEK